MMRHYEELKQKYLQNETVKSHLQLIKVTNMP